MGADGSVHYEITGDGSSLSGAANGGISALTGLSGSAMTVTAALAGITAAATGMGLALKQAMSVETTTTGINTLLKNMNLTKAVMADLQDLSAATPFELGDLAGSARALLGGGSAVKTLREELTVLGDIASGAQTDLAGLVLVFNQVRAAGKLMGGDMMQLNQRGIGGLREELAKIKGVPMADLAKEIEKGNVSADDLYRAFKNLTGQGGLFFKAMEQQSKTLDGMLSTLTDEAKQLLLALGQPMLEPAKQAVGILTAGLQGVTAQAKLFGKELEIAIADSSAADLLALQIKIGIKEGLNALNTIGGEAINAFAKMFQDTMDAVWKEITLQGKSALEDTNPLDGLNTINKNNLFDTSGDKAQLEEKYGKPARDALAKEAAAAKKAMDDARNMGGAGAGIAPAAGGDAAPGHAKNADGESAGRHRYQRKGHTMGYNADGKQMDANPFVDHRTFKEFFAKDAHMARPKASDSFNDFFHPGRRQFLDKINGKVDGVPALDAAGGKGKNGNGNNKVKDETAAEKLDAIINELKRIRVDE